MFYVLPQGRFWGIRGKDTEEDVAFSRAYSNSFLAFVHSREHPWALFNEVTEPMTFIAPRGARVVPGYRKPQCDVLDTSMNNELPIFMQQRAIDLRHRFGEQ